MPKHTVIMPSTNYFYLLNHHTEDRGFLDSRIEDSYRNTDHGGQTECTQH